MNKIEHIINTNFDGDIQLTDTLINSFKEYAELFAFEAINKFVKEAELSFETIGPVLGAENVVPYIVEDYIENFTLPEHE